MNPEEKTEIILWDWLKINSKNIIEIYFNRKNKINSPVFQTRGLNKKPDFLIKININGFDEFIAMEIKNSFKSKNILDAGKILDVYYKNYIEDKTEYFINDEKIEINYFIVGSDNSMKGFLFKNEDLILAKDSENKSKKYVAEIGLIPKIEGKSSHQFVRELWARQGRMNLNEKKIGIGILISKGIHPYLFCKKYSENKKRWGQRFFEL